MMRPLFQALFEGMTIGRFDADMVIIPSLPYRPQHQQNAGPKSYAVLFGFGNFRFEPIHAFELGSQIGIFGPLLPLTRHLNAAPQSASADIRYCDCVLGFVLETNCPFLTGCVFL